MFSSVPFLSHPTLPNTDTCHGSGCCAGFTFRPSPEREHAVTRPGPWPKRSLISHHLQTLTDNSVASFTPPRHPPPYPACWLLSTPSRPCTRTRTHTHAHVHMSKHTSADQSTTNQPFKKKTLCGSSVVGNQLTFTSFLPLPRHLPRRPRTWTWLKRWSAWCWRSSTPACATRSTITPTWCTRCSTSESSLSSSGRTRPSRTSCKTWTRSVAPFFLGAKKINKRFCYCCVVAFPFFAFLKWRYYDNWILDWQ